MDNTHRLGLPYLLPNQAQKHVTLNESLRRLDALVGLAVLSRQVDGEPLDPQEGDAYILPAGASGANWDGFDVNDVVYFADGAWFGTSPPQGLSAWIIDESARLVWTGAVWTQSEGASVPEFGVNTQADASNRLAVKSDNVLFSHDDITPGSGDIRHVLNRSGDGDTASLLFQTAYSTGAEIGLSGSDSVEMKVSDDGSAFLPALNVRRTDGRVAFPSGLQTPLPIEEGGTAATSGLEALAALGLRDVPGLIGDDQVHILDFGEPVYGCAILAVSNALTSGPTAFSRSDGRESHTHDLVLQWRRL